MLGAVALAVWYGGLGPGLVAIAVGWVGGWFLLDPVLTPFWPDGAAIARWAIALVAALLIVSVLVVLRRGRDQAATAADEAEALRDVTAEIQGLTSALIAAVTPSDVARALVELVPGLVGARGGALGLIEGSELVIVDPRGPVDQTLAPGLRLPLATRAPIREGGARGTPVVARDRASFRREYPDGATLAPYAHGAVAVPINVAGKTVGSMGFPFGRADFLTGAHSAGGADRRRPGRSRRSSAPSSTRTSGRCGVRSTRSCARRRGSPPAPTRRRSWRYATRRVARSLPTSPRCGAGQVPTASSCDGVLRRTRRCPRHVCSPR